MGVKAERGEVTCVNTGVGGGQDQRMSNWARPREDKSPVRWLG